jgi:predicted deacylase
MNKPTTFVTEVLDCFPDSYASARTHFLQAIDDCLLPTRLQPLPLNGELSTEAAWIGDPAAERVLVIISGTHGVEGSVGAAIQQDFLTRLNREPLVLPPGTAALLIFALNPHGFAAHRRCDGDGIDLNRNFIDFSRPLPKNPGYTELAEALHLPDAEREKQFAAYRQAHGTQAFEIAISGGQYTDPSGPFYGGTAPGHGHRAIEKIIQTYQLEGRHLAVVDIHSGLGPYGHGEIICDHLPDTAGFRAAMKWYGAATTAPAEGTSSSVRKEGLLDYRWHSLMEERGSFVTLEFGSYPVHELFAVVLNDHRAWKSDDPDAIRKSAAAMREHFCPADGYWRELILLKGRQVLQQAIEGLNS